MHDEKAPSQAIRATVAVGVLLALIGLVWWLTLIVTGNDAPTSVAVTERQTTSASAPELATPSAQTQPVERRFLTLSEPVLFDDDLGTGTTEFSAVTLNEDTNRLLVADDEGQLFEFDLDGAGLPIVPARRTITVEVGDSDIEGLAWISGATYVLAHEATGELSVVEIDEQQRSVVAANRTRTIDTQVVEVDGAGIEGVTSVESIDEVEFIVAVERPPGVNFIDDDGVTTQMVPLRIGADDIADVWASLDGTIWVLSDVGRVVVRIQVGADGSVRQLQQVDLVFSQGRFEQPEGIVMSRDGTRLYVVGEQPGPGQFTLGLWHVS